MKWIIAVVSALMILMVAHLSLAAERSTAATGVTCKYKDIFKKTASTDYEARSFVANACLDLELSLRERNGRSLPEGEVADLIVEDCANNTICG